MYANSIFRRTRYTEYENWHPVDMSLWMNNRKKNLGEFRKVFFIIIIILRNTRKLFVIYKKGLKKTIKILVERRWRNSLSYSLRWYKRKSLIRKWEAFDQKKKKEKLTDFFFGRTVHMTRGSWNGRICSGRNF